VYVFDFLYCFFLLCQPHTKTITHCLPAFTSRRVLHVIAILSASCVYVHRVYVCIPNYLCMCIIIIIYNMCVCVCAGMFVASIFVCVFVYLNPRLYINMYV
jgi:hypothetical protein